MNALARLGRFVRGRSAEERCGLCAGTVGGVHPHLVQVASGKLHCSCPGCASVLGHSSGAFRRVPERILELPELCLTAEDWQGFAIPVGIAFFLRSTPRGGVVAFYPSPLGAVETSVPDDAWERTRRENPVLESLESDVEALLVRRGGARTEAFIVPIDECYGLVGLMRRTWRGFTGGEGVTKAVEEFFGSLRAKSGGRA